jgi:CubicO group peptidase (beta-lactamase class C family)
VANKTPPAASTPLHTQTGKTLAAEATSLAAGDSIIFQNNGDTTVHIFGTLAGTGTVTALIPANNLAITIATGSNLFGPFDQAIFGKTVTITTATATGSVALYHIPTRLPNGLRNPFETNAAAADFN